MLFFELNRIATIKHPLCHSLVRSFLYSALHSQPACLPKTLLLKLNHLQITR